MNGKTLKSIFTKKVGTAVAGLALLGIVGCGAAPKIDTPQPTLVRIDSKHALLFSCIPPFYQSVQISLYKNNERKDTKVIKDPKKYDRALKKLVRAATWSNTKFTAPSFNSICD